MLISSKCVKREKGENVNCIKYENDENANHDLPLRITTPDFGLRIGSRGTPWN